MYHHRVPEIAEVEIVRRGLQPLVGQRLMRIETQYEKLGIYGKEKPLLRRPLVRLRRRGKLLGLELEGGELIAIHFRMTGHLSLNQPSEKDRVRFDFTNDQLCFTDPRGFGTVDLLSLDQFLGKTGPDLFDDPLTEALEPARVANSKRAAKAVILDQTVVGGIGNYLADESLWLQGVHPQQHWDLLSSEQQRGVLENARATALKAVQAGGVSIRDYSAVDGTSGEMQNQLQCYGRAGLPCLRCGTALVKTRVAGRGTTYCPSCQRVTEPR